MRRVVISLSNLHPFTKVACQQLCQQPCVFVPISAYFSHSEGAETIGFWSTNGKLLVPGSNPGGPTTRYSSPRFYAVTLVEPAWACD
jgi:hypothetical protein